MPNSTPTAVSRYRPAILALTGAAAAYTAYLVYTSLQATPSDGLHRSNAVRRPNTQRRPSRTARIISRLERDVPALGDYSLLGITVPLDPRNLIPPDDLRQAIVHSAPDASEDTIEVETARLYDVFLDRLLDQAFQSRPLAPPEVEAVLRWVGDRLPNSATVSRAVDRHTQRLTDGRHQDVDGADSVALTDISWNSDDDTDGDAIDPDGQTLQRTLYHIAEDRARQEGVIHRGITCNACDEKPIRGTRWHCANCVDFDLCSTCEATNSHTKTHVFYKIRIPAPYLSLAKQEPLYPGRPHMMHHSVNSALKRRLGSETKMEVEEIEALWDQFTCLASTEWESDPNKIGWALDRRAFNHAFIPRYNGFVAAPNLIYDRIFTYYDSDKNGLIGFEEWIKGIDGMHTTDMKIKARIIFNGYDIDGDGYISRRDVLRVFRAYYAIEKEATRNFVAELTEELSVRNALDTIRSGQPLGSAFPPNSLTTPNNTNTNLAQKQNATFDDTTPVVLDNDFEVADRKTVIKAAELSQLVSGSLSKDDEERLVRERWARRQFYVDEEEGLEKPEGANDSDDNSEALNNKEEQDEDYAGPSTPGAKPARTVSRRSSRVHFQDEVNHGTRPQKLASKEPVSEQWGGYEIPELEKDLGKEVLYQITQQAFNELLNPLFQVREDMAMDARDLRSERRKHAKAIDMKLEKDKGWGAYNSEIFDLGIFRFIKCVVEVFCQHMNKPNVLQTIALHTSKSDQEWYTSIIRTAIQAAEAKVLDTLKPRNDDPLDGIAEWNAELCREQLHQEITTAALALLARPDRDVSKEPGFQAEKHQTTGHDPTMPQFRPNAVADLDTDSSSAVVEGAQESTSQSDDENGLEDMPGDNGKSRIGSRGPFFVSVCRNPDGDLRPEAEQTPPGIDFRDSEDRAVSPISPPENLVPAPPTLSPNSEVASDSAPSSRPIRINNFTNTPSLQTLSLQSSPSGTQTLSVTRHYIAHSTNLYAIAPEPDQTAALIRNIRHAAKTPGSPLYTTLLASCETVEHEIRERKGSGLLSFAEFEDAMRDGRLRFLESWMDWVSL